MISVSTRQIITDKVQYTLVLYGVEELKSGVTDITVITTRKSLQVFHFPRQTSPIPSLIYFA